MKFSRQMFVIVCLAVAGCETNQKPSSTQTSGLQASPYQRVGVIAHVDSASATVVVRLDNRETILAEELWVRKHSLEVVAMLKPTGIRTGNSIGMLITRGEPLIGQEVVIKNRY